MMTLLKLCGKYKELKNLYGIVLKDNEELRKDVLNMHGWVEALMTLKDVMLQKVPALKGEMRGIQEVMGLEKMKRDMEELWDKLAVAENWIEELQVEAQALGHTLIGDIPAMQISVDMATMTMSPAPGIQVSHSSPQP